MRLLLAWRLLEKMTPRLAGRYTGSTSSSLVLAVRRRNTPSVSLPLGAALMSYSQTFQRPVQALAPPAVPSTVAVLAVGQRIAKTTFLPS